MYDGKHSSTHTDTYRYFMSGSRSARITAIAETYCSVDLASTLTI